ncbi:AsmA family protein [Mariniradius sediminis]|uniref:AsmA family protein n=1 Tax=Mariniradius sediminis TaxID=2909237 RepID=A0ABS9BY01_9BACT|nr:AsmA-like C-terminal region-containing protein [Mariniradius sediminis]MCF1752938.1 AsmA family protein [Mariniradius sediminis]
MNQHRKKLWLKSAKILGIGLGGLLLLMAIFPIFFKQKAKSQVEELLNEQLVSEISFGDLSLTFFRHFPTLTVSLDDVWLQSAPGFEQDTLLFAKDLSFGVNLMSLFQNQISIKSVRLVDAQINILRDTKGHANFDVFRSTPADTVESESGAGPNIQIQNIRLQSCRLVYEDTDLGLSVLADGLDYSGSGNLQASIFDLSSEIGIRDFGLEYDDVRYFSRNQVKANLLTKINTESTAITFERNQLVINDLPVDFVGKLEFITGGYDINFVLESVDVDFKDMLSLVPEAYSAWLSNLKIQGRGELRASLQGLYMAEDNQMPSILASMLINRGKISHSRAAVPLEELHVEMDLTIPSLNMMKTEVSLDSIHFKLGDGFLNGHYHVKGLDPSEMSGQLNAKVDLELLDQALDIQPYDLKGLMTWNVNVDGVYATKPVEGSFRKPKYKTSSVPKFTIESSLNSGFLHWISMPEALHDISYQLKLQSPDSIPDHMVGSIENLRFRMLDNFAEGYLKVNSIINPQIDAKLDASVNLSEIVRFYPLDSGFVLGGQLDVGLTAKGAYDEANMTFPVARANFKLNDGLLRTPYAPEAIEDASLSLDILSEKGTFEDATFDLHPVSFSFAGSPFTLTANLSNLEDIRYEVVSKGRIDLGKLYRTFGVEGYDLSGYILTDLEMKGQQSDAMAGRFGRLDNKGTVVMENIQLRPDWVPHPVQVVTGRLRVDADRLYLEDFEAKYLENSLQASGYLYGLIAYATESDRPLSGKLDIKSPRILVNDFMFFAEYGSDSTNATDSISQAAGVVMIPSGVDFQMNAAVGEVVWDDLKLEKFKGNLSVKDTKLVMDNTTFELIGAQFLMDGDYQAFSPWEAGFSYRIKASGFDIQRAYQEISLFREMASAAAYASGKASLDYKLSGKLDANMYPVMPSIQGEGVLGLDDIRLKGFKLMNTIAKDTDNAELRDPSLSNVQIKTKIANNLMTIERTRMRIAGFRPRFEGQVSLDGDMSIAFRLGLPPLGIFGIPIKITGNAENPIIEVGKITEEDQLEETAGPTGENQ